VLLYQNEDDISLKTQFSLSGEHIDTTSYSVWLHLSLSGRGEKGVHQTVEIPE